MDMLERSSKIMASFVKLTVSLAFLVVGLLSGCAEKSNEMASQHAVSEPVQFESIFNGENLNGWDGDPRLWSVEDGKIIGQNYPKL